jgi:hypothetical protein
MCCGKCLPDSTPQRHAAAIPEIKLSVLVCSSTGHSPHSSSLALMYISVWGLIQFYLLFQEPNTAQQT